MSNSKIITDEFLPQINQALQNLDTFDTEYELAIRAGLGNTALGQQLTKMKEQADLARERLLSVKQTYFPGQ